jgi:hypothetical protein
MTRALIAIALSLTLLCGCTKKLAGKYTGKLSESSDIMKDGSLPTPYGPSTNTTLEIVAEGDKLSTVVKGCKILFKQTPKGDADTTSDQTCRISIPGYDGTAKVKGTLSREGRWLNAVFNFAPTEPKTSGALVVLFSGTAP